ncbi:hypothetical protein L1987_57052 [Smallanthus sonchifolius]|uniref:Uncharacterized protein n=1 Tax=Smallanthus sonchifolius TaxID=185202 RepID=A0ACB9DBY5_9ASTR|nr:hypothetical protein L1987_57052 [Smallanthus sonchifolius]
MPRRSPDQELGECSIQASVGVGIKPRMKENRKEMIAKKIVRRTKRKINFIKPIGRQLWYGRSKAENNKSHGFEIKYEGDVRYLERMFDSMVKVHGGSVDKSESDLENEYLESYFETLGGTINHGDQIRQNLEQIREFNEEFKNMVDWFYGKHANLGLDRPLPPIAKE